MFGSGSPGVARSSKHPAAPPPGPETPFMWSKTRQRPNTDKTLICSMQGYGPRGDYTLFLVSSSAKKRQDFVNGKLVMRAVPECRDAGLLILRDKVLRALVLREPRTIGIACELFYEYAVYVLNLSYQSAGTDGEPLTDEELGFILAGDKWHAALLNHALGFGDSIQTIRETGALDLSPRMIPPPMAPAMTVPARPAITPAPPSPPTVSESVRILLSALLRKFSWKS
jgi:hypothetical protein